MSKVTTSTYTRNILHTQSGVTGGVPRASSTQGYRLHTSTSTLDWPDSTRIGSLPGGSLTSSAALPGQVKPLMGQALGAPEPVGAQKPDSTSIHCNAW
jgi:hypothetical protein